MKYGAQGYGIYWYCLELIARNVEKHNLTFELEHDAEIIADDFKLSSDLVQHIMTFMVDIGLFENTNNVITCLKMSTRTDEYTQKLIQSKRKCPDTIPTLSAHYPEKSVLIEEKRREEKRKSLGEKIAPIAKGKVLSVDWVLPKAWGDWAKTEKPDFSNEQIRVVAEIFKDHWLANSNQANAKKSDWEATWRNWVRKQTVAPVTATKPKQVYL